MFKSIVVRFSKLMFVPFNLILKYNYFVRVYNLIYNYSPHFLVKLFVRFVDFPRVNITWNVMLFNKKNVITPIKIDDQLTYEFAMSYRWHSRGLAKIESLLNDHYSIDIPWIDIGANMGLRSLYALSISRPVFMFEPNTDLKKYIEERCIINSFGNYEIFEIGVSNQKGEATFYIDETTYNSSLENKVAGALKVDRRVQVQVDKLDSIMAGKIDGVSTFCMKIDVEGHEYAVLSGALDLIRKYSPTMIIEINEKGDHFVSIVKLLSELNYQIFEVGYFGIGRYSRCVDIMTVNNFKYNDFLFTTDIQLIEKLK